MEAVDRLSLMREQTERQHEVRPGGARAPAQWFQNLGLRAGGLRRDGPDEGFDQLTQWGYRPLRERLALSLADRQINVSPEHVLLTLGANHALANCPLAFQA